MYDCTQFDYTKYDSRSFGFDGTIYLEPISIDGIGHPKLSGSVFIDKIELNGSVKAETGGSVTVSTISVDGVVKPKLSGATYIDTITTNGLVKICVDGTVYCKELSVDGEVSVSIEGNIFIDTISSDGSFSGVIVPRQPLQLKIVDDKLTLEVV